MNMTCDMFKSNIQDLKTRGNLIPSVMSIYFRKNYTGPLKGV